MITRLDHANLRTTQLDVMVEWYERILGFTSGWRPPFPFPGAWIYAADQALVHLVTVEGDIPASDNLTLEHVAFSAHGIERFRAHLAAHGERCEEVRVPGTNILQFNIWDPDGNHLHIDFDVTEDA